MTRKKSSLKFRQVPPKEENAEMVQRFRQWLCVNKTMTLDQAKTAYLKGWTRLLPKK